MNFPYYCNTIYLIIPIPVVFKFPFTLTMTMILSHREVVIKIAVWITFPLINENGYLCQ